MANDEVITTVPKAMRALRAEGNTGMTRERFFALCRTEDGVDNPMPEYRALLTARSLVCIEGSVPLRVRINMM